MKETELPETDLRTRALALISEERRLAIEANLQHKSVEELSRHINNYELYCEFAIKLGIMTKADKEAILINR